MFNFPSTLFSDYGKKRTKAEILAAHEAARINMSAQAAFGIFTLTGYGVCKPSLGSLSDLSACTPMQISALHVGTTHSRRSIRGRIVVRPLLMASVMTVIEGEDGDVVKLAVYNLFPSGRKSIQDAEKLFPIGQMVIIKDPFYKLYQDGSCGLRVDDPQDIVFDNSTLPDNAAAEPAVDWLARGKSHFVVEEWDEAIQCYRKVIEDTAEEVTNVLNNLALVYQTIGDITRAILCSFAATVISPSSPKAYMRLAISLEQNGNFSAAKFCAKKACKSSNKFKPLLKELLQRVASFTDVADNSYELELLCARLLIEIGVVFPTHSENQDRKNHGGIVSLVALKEKGNRYFKAGAYEDAIVA